MEKPVKQKRYQYKFKIVFQKGDDYLVCTNGMRENMVNNHIWLMNSVIKVIDKYKTMIPREAYLEIHDTRKSSTARYEMKINEDGIVYEEVVI